jgi:hypothetical protein
MQVISGGKTNADELVSNQTAALSTASPIGHALALSETVYVHQPSKKLG